MTLYPQEHSTARGIQGSLANLGSESWTKQSKLWIQHCNTHAKCCQQQEVPFKSERSIPSNLIDLTNPSKPKLVRHYEIDQKVSYSALSYCWGINQTYVLTKGSMNDRLRELDTAQLQRTILDAIEVTVNLGYSYLWVDSLCIIQDGISDFDEIAVMDQIYSRSEVTIVAANASSAEEGFLKDPEQSQYFVDPINIPVGDGGKRLTIAYRSHYKPSKDPINSRAWTLQERILSRRCLIFSYDGLKWLCREIQRNPNGPPEAPIMFPQILSDATTDDDFRQSWLEIRAEYTSRKMTQPSDKLRAISAITNQISTATGWTYLAGLWKEYLFFDLHWNRDRESMTPIVGSSETMNRLMSRPEKYRAPSWSWASVDGQVVDAGDDELRTPLDFEIISSALKYDGESEDAKFHFAPIVSGLLIVKGRVAEYKWRSSTAEDISADLYLLEVEDGVEYICGEATWDAVEPSITTQSTLYCLAMSVLELENRKRQQAEGMLLVPTEYPTFRRVGYFRIFSKTMFSDVPEAMIQIV
jgi:Heterokaryon incompatibility protein (HET)